MKNQPRRISTVPYDSLASGIMHGPYPSAPQEQLDFYLGRHHQQPELNPGINDEQKLADIESEWQYDQHSEAVMEALKAERITPLHAHFMLDEVLRPWFIGRRNPSD